MKKYFLVIISTLALLFFFKMGFTQQQDCKVLLESIAGEYEGECKKGLAHGEGTAIGTDLYTGNFKKGWPHGEGKYTWSTGEYYVGKFKNGKKSGLGKFMLADGSIAKEGIWKGDEFFKEQEVPDYTIGMRRNVLSVNIRDLAVEEDKVEIVLIRDGRESTKNVYDLMIVANSGLQYNDGHSIVYREITYPFKANIKFKSAGKLSQTTVTGTGSDASMTTNISQMPESVVDFEIKEPGCWQVRIKY